MSGKKFPRNNDFVAQPFYSNKFFILSSQFLEKEEFDLFLKLH